MSGYIDDPLYAQIEDMVFKLGGWQTAGPKLGLSGDGLKHAARTLSTRRQTRDNLYNFCRTLPRAGKKKPAGHGASPVSR